LLNQIFLGTNWTPSIPEIMVEWGLPWGTFLPIYLHAYHWPPCVIYVSNAMH